MDGATINHVAFASRFVDKSYSALPAAAAAIPLARGPAEPGDALRSFGHRIDLDTLWNSARGPARQWGRLADGYAWRGKKLAVDADVVIAQLPTEDGDSGGPVVNSRGELVGLLFDGTYESIISDWDYMPERTRSIHVDMRYALWVMDQVDGAQTLVQEMGLGRGAASGAANATPGVEK